MLLLPLQFERLGDWPRIEKLVKNLATSIKVANQKVLPNSDKYPSHTGGDVAIRHRIFYDFSEYNLKHPANKYWRNRGIIDISNCKTRWKVSAKNQVYTILPLDHNEVHMDSMSHILAAK